MNNTKGFTLLEVIIALTIFCIAGLSIMKIISERLRWINILEQRMISSWVAENVLTEIKILKIEQTNEWLMGQESMAGRIWHWQSRSIKLQDDRMDIIFVEVRNNKESEHPDFSLEGYKITND
ncbi:type II secretion system minor pseudopilin GspI [Yersinia pseudotuberculosis]|uniref:Type II secretion system protein I n=3 Tax=Yersinia pseudotuberculosis complex TaxID=1649845 RepID=A0ABN5R5C6_YERPU|nr:type II secretion system minor pseudopilin GspI [Yersinia pseudotuberculosis]AYW92193.1 type II secretion system protein GspI [Yersinia pseudotuberculosis]AYW96410.1 type II secretion system protein GspI [Yersinia pseudotuberculosis]MBO1555510.1 type II secretion system protein GspI [Yersinia pseudotuberculosis]MBO1561911.1 type II secretion system protein GspI [Yersinia pseudotuberculosis]MBO1630017.1 type II secretion system minor pseudopilin GspI [Yersinia pseudotuberculosis]